MEVDRVVARHEVGGFALALDHLYLKRRRPRRFRPREPAGVGVASRCGRRSARGRVSCLAGSPAARRRRAAASVVRASLAAAAVPWRALPARWRRLATLQASLQAVQLEALLIGEDRKSGQTSAP